VLLDAFTKSVQFPFHFWLPNAMVAPAPVSAYLHSVTMVKSELWIMKPASVTLPNWGACEA
jgi:NADH:ubiquinone oxidoreductase subunit 5 (subunit L)/multisubunit Na+/H+ antiporter MnhA subunit